MEKLQGGVQELLACLKGPKGAAAGDSAPTPKLLTEAAMSHKQRSESGTAHGLAA